VVDRHVVAQTRPLEAGRDLSTGLAERGCEEVRGVFDPFERPPAMDDANLESGSKKPAVAPAPAGVFRQVRRPKLRDVVPTVVVEDEEAPARPKNAFGLDELDRRETPGAGSWFIRATCYDRLGRKAEAVAAYEKFVALDQGRSENQGFQARQRIRILARELEHKKR